MDARIEVTTKINQWEPPFEKSETVVEYQGAEGEEFDNDLGENAFKIHKIEKKYVIIEFNHKFTPKKSQYVLQEDLVEGKFLKLPKNLEIELGYMWGNKGITKKVKFLGVVD
jgi:predicted AlkP superfamily phosphohydrolase/phosphomutase